MHSSAESPTSQLRVRERQFLRAVTQHDYAHESDSIRQAQAAFIADRAAQGADDCFVTFFNYMYVPVQIDVHSVVDSPLAARLSELGAEWTDILRRLRLSDGRLQLHVLEIPEGRHGRLWVVPVRTEIHEKIQHQLASSLMAEEDSEGGSDVASENNNEGEGDAGLLKNASLGAS